MMQRHQIDGASEPNPLGARSDRRVQHHRGGHHGEMRHEMNLGEPDGRKAKLVGEHRFGDQITISIRRALRIRLRELIEDVEVHEALREVLSSSPSASARMIRSRRSCSFESGS